MSLSIIVKKKTAPLQSSFFEYVYNLTFYSSFKPLLGLLFDDDRSTEPFISLPL